MVSTLYPTIILVSCKCKQYLSTISIASPPLLPIYIYAPPVLDLFVEVCSIRGYSMLTPPVFPHLRATLRPETAFGARIWRNRSWNHDVKTSLPGCRCSCSRAFLAMYVHGRRRTSASVCIDLSPRAAFSASCSRNRVHSGRSARGWLRV